MKKFSPAILIVVLSSNVLAGVAFNIDGSVDVVEGDTITIDIISDAGGVYCAYLDCDGAIITVPIARPAAGTSTSIVPDPESCGYDLCVTDPISPVAGIHFTFMLITNDGDAGASYTLSLLSDNWTVTMDTLVVHVIDADCMQEAGIDIADPVRYAAFLEAGSPECWCYPKQCHGDADSRTERLGLKTGYFAVASADLMTLLAGWGTLEPPFGPGVASQPDVTITDSDFGPYSVKAACANFDNDAWADPLIPGSGTFTGGKEGDAKTGYYHIGGGDLAILITYWGINEPSLGPGVPGDCLPGNR